MSMAKGDPLTHATISIYFRPQLIPAVLQRDRHLEENR